MDDTTIDQPETHTANSVTLQKMMAEQVQADICYPPHHKLKPGIQSKLDALLKEYESQFAKDETSIRTALLMEMTIDTGNSDPISQKPYPIAMKNYQWVKADIEKLLTAKVICSSRSSWSATSSRRRQRKAISHQLPSFKQSHQKSLGLCPKVKDIFSKLNGAKYFSTLDLRAGYHLIPLDKSLIPKTASQFSFWQVEYIKVPFGLPQVQHIFRN